MIIIHVFYINSTIQYTLIWIKMKWSIIKWFGISGGLPRFLNFFFVYIRLKSTYTFFIQGINALNKINSIIKKMFTNIQTFEQWVLELWYITWVFLVIRPFTGTITFFTLWPWPWSLTNFLKTLTLLRTFKQWVLELSLIHIWRCRRYAVCRSRWSPYH